ncbi:flavin-containing monooxygenase [Planctomonas deserti]|uniref:flavin-containing monooxygenase n=1 Tax=Planctomonas deserti TaxID=2144185 RepID=UPI000D3BD6DA|nr:NAD(P)/FAD-dependent oxidoreductase [Planctomonas deserti]
MTPEHLDVLIVGAGLSGVGAAIRLTRHMPDASFALIEARDTLGGTWDLFRYPGVRSDSDMFTLGFRDRPWADARMLAPGGAILDYVRESAKEFGVVEHIRYGLRVTRAEWSTADALWTVTAERTGTGAARGADGTDDADGGGEAVRFTCGFLYVCSGYYRYDEGYTPDLPGIGAFAGDLVHPQHWPAELGLGGREVVVIGSGATAVTLVPALAERGAHVTMLQRSPTYIAAVPAVDRTVERVLGRWSGGAPRRVAMAVIRWRSILSGIVIYQASRRVPGLVKRVLRRRALRALPPGFDIDRHLAPVYNPWDERLCATPDGDFFAAIRTGAAEIVTDGIAEITPAGVRLTSGRELPADVLVTATGFQLMLFGGIAFSVDGADVDLSRATAYKGMMVSGLPNFAFAMGYTNASWTLKIDLVNDHIVRLLRRMRRRGYRVVVPRETASAFPARPLLPLKSGYIARSAHLLPKQGSRTPWRLHQNYLRDTVLLRARAVESEGLEFRR